MRNFIFKSELEYIFLRHSVKEKEQLEIKEILLKNARITDKGKIYFLRIVEPQSLDDLKKVAKNDNFLAELSQMLSLDDDLYMPAGLKQKILDNEKVAVFVGAGVSKLLGYPLWGELAENAIDFLRSEGQIDNFQSSRIINDVSDPKQKLSILESFFDKGSEKRRSFYESQLLPKNEKITKANPYDVLVDQVFNWIKITSNVDLAFGNALKTSLDQKNKTLIGDEDRLPKVISLDDLIVYSDFSTKKLEQSKIYHLHGVIKEPSSIIFTTLDYIDTYYKKDKPTYAFLHELFNEYTVVFMGYGLEELQILESVINGEEGKPRQRHYALFGAYLNEMNFFNIRRDYFSNSMNIELQHYYLDFERHDRILRVLESWKEGNRNCKR